MRIQHPKKKTGTPLPPALCFIGADKVDITSKGLRETLEGKSADMCVR